MFNVKYKYILTFLIVHFYAWFTSCFRLDGSSTTSYIFPTKTFKNKMDICLGNLKQSNQDEFLLQMEVVALFEPTAAVETISGGWLQMLLIKNQLNFLINFSNGK